MKDFKLGINLWTQTGTWQELLDAAAAVDRLGYEQPLGLGPPQGDLRRPAPADLRGLDDDHRLGHGHAATSSSG